MFTVKEQYVDDKMKISHVGIVYLVEKNVKIEELVLQKEEVSDVKYVPYKEFEKMLVTQKEQIVEHDEIYKRILAILHEKFD